MGRPDASEMGGQVIVIYRHGFYIFLKKKKKRWPILGDSNLVGKPGFAAVVDAAVSRARPVFLGAFTTILGVAPLLMDPFFKSMAVTIMFGLAFATVLTLIVVPLLYVAIFRIRPVGS